jgi:hypothetical protein
MLFARPQQAAASTKFRHFEPDDLELEHPGVLDFDFQAGPLAGNSTSGNHVVLPDFEIGLGLTPSVELDVSGTVSFAERGIGPRVSSDALWVATKLGLFDAQVGPGTGFAVGLELGPRLPTLAMAGVGYGALALFGFNRRTMAWVLNAGSFIDPAPGSGEPHPSRLVTGLDFNASLDARGVWSVQSEFGAVYSLGSDPHEISFSLGATYAVDPRLDLSLTALGGILPNTDRAGLLLGVSPQWGLW